MNLDVYRSASNTGCSLAWTVCMSLLALDVVIVIVAGCFSSCCSLTALIVNLVPANPNAPAGPVNYIPTNLHSKDRHRIGIRQ